MKNTVLISFVFAASVLLMSCGGNTVTTTSTGTSIIVKGTYNGNNLYVKNPYASDGLGYCVNEIYINGNRTSDEINAESIEIDLKASGVHEGHDITIEIRHEKGCEPKVLNPDVLK